MIHKAFLSELPAGFEVPDDLKARLSYDLQHKQLRFDGFMSKATFDRLGTLSHNREYQSALEELFRVCLPEDEVRASLKRTLMTILTATTAVIAIGGVVLWLMLR